MDPEANQEAKPNLCPRCGTPLASEIVCPSCGADASASSEIESQRETRAEPGAEPSG